MQSEHPYMEGLSLFDRQRLYYNGSHCPYCGKETDLIDSIKVYQESHGLIYYCKNGCEAWVGVHSGTDKSLGTLAKKELRKLRHECHKFIDPMWKVKKEATGITTKSARAKLYRWISELLSIEREAAHVGYLNSQQCKTLIEECKKYFK